MKNTLSITIGIPAHNEERNIQHLLLSILAQKADFILEKIIVVCDGCIDETEECALEIAKAHYGLIEVMNDHEWKGKADRMNEIFRMSKSDVVIIIDADIKIAGKLKSLVEPMETEGNENIMLVSGNLLPIVPKTFAGRIGITAHRLWMNAVDMLPNTDMYRCGGPLRAFKRKFYEGLEFPSASADDIYPYLAAQKLGFGFAFAESVSASYKLPGTLKDFRKQMGRFLESKSIHENNFSPEFLKNYYTITSAIKLKALVKTFFQFPISTVCYVVVWVPIKLKSLMSAPTAGGTWDSVASTK